MIRLLTLLTLIPLLGKAQEKADCEGLNEFSSLQIYDGIIVTLEKGDSYQLCPGANTKMEDLEITFSDSNMKIRKISGKHYEKTPAIKIVFNKLDLLECYGKADVATKNLIKQDSLKIVLKSGATLYADLDLKYLEVEATEGALLKADGYANEQYINVAVKATVSAFSLEGISGEVKTNTGGTAKVNIEKKLQASANTGGQVRYKGTPYLDPKASFGGKILRDEEE